MFLHMRQISIIPSRILCIDLSHKKHSQRTIDRFRLLACNKKLPSIDRSFFVLPYFSSRTNKQQKTMPLSRKYVPLDSDSDVRRDSSLSDTDNCVKARRDVQRCEDERGKKSRWKEWRKKLGGSGEMYREGQGERTDRTSEERVGVKATASSSKPPGIFRAKRPEDEKQRKKQPWWDVIVFAGPI